ncbi:medium-chain acyl-CoA ligase ACSF2, mitochondrial isoform X2 [Xenopus laevis]|uniref:Medium-chain acyl-CoA ligase ACSF2, mitochondrial n=1 Tax=Xenopus laevis TaxID=8355 RepID=A0A8J1LZC6_XENLA|nr:medium-chain acyl-CoA ligase ACSF2, mitochondrial isoform X2 [Xenopus laevis]
MAQVELVQVLIRKALGAGWRRVWYRAIHRGSYLLSDFSPARPVTNTSYIHGTCDVPLTSKTVHQCLLETTDRTPDLEAVVFRHSNIRKTFSQLIKDVDSLAAGLVALGLKKGDLVGMWGPNSYEWILVQFATARAGIILVSVNPAYQSRELEYVLRKVKCCALVFPSQFKTQKYYELLSAICPELETSPAGGLQCKKLPDLHTVIVLDKRHPGTFLFHDVMEAGNPSSVQQLQDLQKKISCDDPINIQFTSGTTGSPKGATLSHHNIVNNASLGGRRMGFNWRKIAYGTTENSPVTFMGFPHDNFIRKTETVGHVLSHTEAKVVDTTTGQIVPLNAPGELLIRGYCVMLEYWDDPEKTKEVMTPANWYKTGDIATMDEYGYCRIVGRCKDMIIRGGENIYPAEIEDFLHTHPSILEAQVIGVKDERMGEEVCACIRLYDNNTATAADIKEYCKGKISHFKIPRYIVFVNDYPLTVSGKIQKYTLREKMEKELNL